MAEQEARCAMGGIGKPMLHVLGEVREVRHWPATRRFVLMLLSVVFLWQGGGLEKQQDGGSMVTCHWFIYKELGEG